MLLTKESEEIIFNLPVLIVLLVDSQTVPEIRIWIALGYNGMFNIQVKAANNT